MKWDDDLPSNWRDVDRDVPPIGDDRGGLAMIEQDGRVRWYVEGTTSCYVDTLREYVVDVDELL